MTASTGRSFRFGEFELDLPRFELRRGGARVEVQPKALRLLCHLAEHRERAVDNAELLRTLWPDAQVTAGSIKRAVLGARQALGERAADQSTIRTVRGHGYQFVREVELLTPVPTAQPARPEPSFGQDVFLGREHVLQLLEGSLHEALLGTPRCVLLTGGPGLGKTRTAEELFRRARTLGAQTWLGRCPDMEGVPAFWPFVEMLRAALKDRGATELGRLLGREGADLAEAMPELRGLVHELPAHALAGPDAARFRVYDAVSCFLRRASAAQPVVLGLDDLHQADPASLQLVTFLTRQLVDARVLIVATMRRAPEVPPLLAALLRQDGLRSVELRGFSRTELERYLQRTAGAAPPSDVVARMHEATAGNPLFVRHVIESWRALGEPAAEAPFGGLSSLPESEGVRGAILRHLEIVSEDCRQLLRSGAVLGRELSTALLARVCEQELDAVCALLAEAEATGLIKEQPGELAVYRFTHALIRDALYAQLTAAERAALHGRAARALEQLEPGTQSYVRLCEITRHFVLAAPACDHGQALGYSLRAAESALARLAHEEAAEHFERALQLSAFAPPDPPRQLALLLRKGEALARASEPEAGRAVLFEAAERAAQLADHEALFAAASLLAGRPEPGSVDEAQLALLERAHAALPESDGRRVLLLAMQAKSLAYAPTPAERVRRGRQALGQARALREPALRADALTRCLDALVGPDHLDERCGIAAELLDMAQPGSDPGALLRAWAAQIETSVERGDMRGVDLALGSMEELALRVREPIYRWQARAVRSMRAFVNGQLGLAEQHARDALQLGAAVGEELARHIYGAQTFSLLLLTDRPEQADELGREMAERYPGIAGWVAATGVSDALRGRQERARSCLDQIMERGLDWIRSEPYMLSGLCSVSELCQLVRSEAAARALYGAILPYADHHGLTHLGATNYGPMQRQLAGLAACSGDVASADRHYERARQGARALPSPTFESLTSLAHAQLLLAHGRSERREQAALLLTQARELAERCGMPAIVAGCQLLAAAHGLDKREGKLIRLPRSRRGSRA